VIEWLKKRKQRKEKEKDCPVKVNIKIFKFGKCTKTEKYRENGVLGVVQEYFLHNTKTELHVVNVVTGK